MADLTLTELLAGRPLERAGGPAGPAALTAGVLFGPRSGPSQLADFYRRERVRQQL